LESKQSLCWLRYSSSTLECEVSLPCSETTTTLTYPVPHESLPESHTLFIILLLFILTANGFLPGGNGTTIRRNTQITHHAETKHSTQNYTNIKEHITRNKYNANTNKTTTNAITTTIIQININKKISILSLNSNSNEICNVMN
jgi:hypothetical protein